MLEYIFNQQLLENAFNRALNLDPDADQKLRSLNERRIGLQLENQRQPFIFIVREQRFYLDDGNWDDCDVKLSGSLGGFLRLFNENNNATINEKLYIEGDVYCAQQFQKAMANLKPDFQWCLKEQFGQTLGGLCYDSILQAYKIGDKVSDVLRAKLRAHFENSNYLNSFLNKEEFTIFKRELIDFDNALTALDAQIKSMEKL